VAPVGAGVAALALPAQANMATNSITRAVFIPQLP
jgi:hypothetical protein